MLAGAQISFAQDATKVAGGSLETISGVGGWTEVAYRFAAGDAVTVTYKSNKKLARVSAETGNLRYAVNKLTKEGKLVFTVPKEENVAIHFTSDRAGIATIEYEVMRTPAADGDANFDTTPKKKEIGEKEY